jgi:glycosyltransferase 2 family protein
VIALGTAALSGAQATGGSVWRSALALAIVSVLVVVMAVWLVRHEAQALGWWSALTGPLPARLRQQARDLAASAMRGLQSLRSPGRLAAAGLLSVLIWVLTVLSLFAYFRALSSALPASTLWLALTLFILTQAISVTPGSLGTYEALFVITLRAFGASPAATVLAVALLSHLIGIAVVLVLAGLGGLWLRLVQPVPQARAESLPQS